MFSEDLIKLICCMLILIPLSFFLRFIKPTHYRYMYSLTISLLLQLYVYKQHMIGLYVQQFIVFFILKAFKGKKIGAFVTIQSMLYLAIFQVKEIIYNYGGWTMDATALLMIQVCKYSLLAYSIQDGLTSQQKLTEQQKKYRINPDISLYDFFGFINFLPTAIMGPPIQFIQYKKFMELLQPYEQIPSTVPQTLKVLSHAVLCGAIYVLGQFITPVSYMKTDQFFGRNAFYVLFYSFISMTLIRFKYYFGWKLIMGSVNASGLSFDGQKFHLINTCSPLVIETDMHIRTKISHWNTTVQEWLRKAIYQRSPFKSKGVSQLYVFMISAFWHGFYAGYYFAFFLWFVQVYTQGQIFRFVKSQTSRLKRFYKSLGFLGNIGLTLLVSIVFSHNATFFILLDYSLSIRLLQKVNYIPQTILITLGITFTILNMTRSKKQRKLSGQLKKQEKEKDQKHVKDL